MRYEIFGENLPAVKLFLNRSESVYTQTGGMSWMSGDIKMETSTKGGVLKSFSRMFSGDSFFMATYLANEDNCEITFSMPFPGNILAVDVARQSLVVQRGAFLCGESSVEIEAYMSKKFSSGLFGGEGLVLQKLSGKGMAFVELDGTIEEKELREGEQIIVSTGHVAAFETSVALEVQRVKGVKNMFLGGEGIFYTKLTGPGKIWLQTMTLQGLADKLHPLLNIPSATTSTSQGEN